ncbi:MAG: hypothetical protein M3Y64_09410, partial [Gemmatimonadota bacterium]|nr:hypothetical protein [Gemmatimonadota bacterium]
VKKFRKSLRFFLVANGALVAVSLFTTNKDFLGVTTIWTVIMAFKYAKLWSNDHDWRDVLHQPRNRMLGEVVSHIQDSVMATFSRKHREQLQSEGRLGNKLGISLAQKTPVGAVAAGGVPSASRAQPVTDDVLGAYATLVNRARTDRDEIVRLLSYLPAPERARIPEVANTANTLVGKIEIIAMSMARTERDTGARPASEINAEIQQLESEANPFDTTRSETRVRRLAQLRRECRLVVDITRQREENRARLESCRLALENVRLDLVRLRTGNSSVQSVTLVAEQAMALAREVDIAVAAASEVRDLTRARSS